VALQQANIRCFWNTVIINIVPYNQGNTAASAMGMQSKIVRVVDYPFFLDVRFFYFENITTF
jgi:hypothetical protein